MSFHLKRFVFFFCILNFGLGCCFGNRANAQDSEIIYRLFLSSVFYQHDPMKIIGRVFLLTDYTIGLPDVVIYSAEPFPGEEGIGPDTQYVPVAVTDGNGNYVFTPEDRWYHLIPRKNGYQFTPEASIGRGYNFMWPDFAAYWPREISGRVTYSDGSGFANVGIYHNTIQVAVTDIQGYYKASLPPSEYTLIPQKSGYLFTPPSLPVPADQSNHGNLDFTAQTAVTISGNVKWTNGMFYTIPSNPLPMVAMEGYAEDGSLYYRAATNVDGNYSITVPSGWRGWIKPSKESFEFSPEKINYSSLVANDMYNFSAPRPTVSGGHVYKITVSVKLANNNVPPQSNHIYIQFDGIDYANGSHLSQTGGAVLDSLTGECYTYSPQGWIGDITPTNDGIFIGYNFNPVSIRMSNPITSDMTFSFTATPK